MTANTLLQKVAKAKPAFHSLIDTGALVTGLDNIEVANELLKPGHFHMLLSIGSVLIGSGMLPSHIRGVVYLDNNDAKKVLMRANGRSVALEQCGLEPNQRFSFYDQASLV